MSVPVYYNAHVTAELEFARELHERIRREFPEVRSRCSRHPTLRSDSVNTASHLQGSQSTRLTSEPRARN